MAPRCNINLKAQWNVGKWRAPALAGAARLYFSALLTPASGPKRCAPIAAALGVPCFFGARAAPARQQHDAGRGKKVSTELKSLPEEALFRCCACPCSWCKQPRRHSRGPEVRLLCHVLTEYVVGALFEDFAPTAVARQQQALAPRPVRESLGGNTLLTTAKYEWSIILGERSCRLKTQFHRRPAA